MQPPETATTSEFPDRVDPTPRSPARAAAYSAGFYGAGQLYNRQLERAVLFWIWGVIYLSVGFVLLVMGLIGRFVTGLPARPPIADWIADHAGVVALLWLLAGFALWAGNIWHAYASARAIQSGRITIRYSMRRQMVHVLGSQLLGFIPLVGIFFPPGVVAEALDAVNDGRQVDRERVVREGGQAFVEWVLTRLAFYAVWAFLALWLLWWLLRIVGLVP